MNDITVRCYSSHDYAAEPRSFSIGGVERDVVEVVRSWREPGKKCFLVRTGDSKFFKLCYNESKDSWTVNEVVRR